MTSHSYLEEKHVISARSNSQEEGEYSRPSSASHNKDAVQHAKPRDEAAEDKEAQVDARSTVTAESAIPPPPDGGLHAWLKVFGGFMIYINIWYVIHPSIHLTLLCPFEYTTPPIIRIR